MEWLQGGRRVPGVFQEEHGSGVVGEEGMRGNGRGCQRSF